MDRELVDYIRAELNAGRSPEEIKRVLIGQGWRETDVDEAINSVTGVQTAGAAEPSREEEEKPAKKRSKKKIIILIIAIIVIAYLLLVFGTLIVSVILYQLMLFSPGGGTSQISTGFSGFGKPLDYTYSGTRFEITFPPVEYGRTVRTATADGCDPASGVRTPAGEDMELTFTGCNALSSGERYSVELKITYTKEDVGWEMGETGTANGIAV